MSHGASKAAAPFLNTQGSKIDTSNIKGKISNLEVSSYTPPPV